MLHKENNNQTSDNITLIMSGGSGQRFGADKPKQYCYMNDRPIIEYVIDACRLATNTDDIVIVTTAEYVDSIHEKYGFATTVGGSTRTESLANGLKYIAMNYNCGKVIVVNAVCPLVTENQIDRYFDMLDDYDYVLTSWKVTSTLHRYDGKFVNRNDYFHVMEPEAYRFKLLYDNYKSDFPVPYIFHQLPCEAKGYYCFDYPYTMKITYADDVKIAGMLYNDIILRPKQDRIKQNINKWLSSFDNSVESITDWISNIANYMNVLVNHWEIVNFTMNPQTFATCVFEAESKKFGSVIIKFHAPSGRYDLELEYYKLANENMIAELLDYDNEYRVLLIKKITPGMNVKFNENNINLRKFYDYISTVFIPANVAQGRLNIPTIMGEFEQNVVCSNRYNFQMEFKKKLEEKVRNIWEIYFNDSEQYFLHRDLHRRNILTGSTGVLAIDPLGIIGPKEFEYTITFIIEGKIASNRYMEMHDKMMNYFTKYCKYERLYAALFITWVHKMDEYIFVKHDNFKLANWTADVIKNIFFGDDSWKLDGKRGFPKKLRIKKGDNFL